MGGEIREVRIVLTVPDSDQLPDGLYPDDVVNNVATAARIAVDDYHARHPDHLKCPPDVL
jgi:hypothetical protein